jgi:hypothetical protein
MKDSSYLQEEHSVHSVDELGLQKVCFGKKTLEQHDLTHTRTRTHVHTDIHTRARTHTHTHTNKSTTAQCTQGTHKHTNRSPPHPTHLGRPSALLLVPWLAARHAVDERRVAAAKHFAQRSEFEGKVNRDLKKTDGRENLRCVCVRVRVRAYGEGEARKHCVWARRRGVRRKKNWDGEQS